MACCCNTVGTGSVTCVCGAFPVPTVPDQGQCVPYREKRDCEAPVLPPIECDDDEYTTVFQPENESNPFKVSARLFDQDCEPILDENDEPILTFLT